MTAIPLHCNVCPKEPDFSDISHLLTHVASKGHLSHYHKAQIRGRQDQNIRQKIDDYDLWYEKYQIEKFLSQRMITKESKDTTRKVRSVQSTKVTSLKPPRSTKSRKRRSKASLANELLSSSIKPEVAIDPQLAESLLPPLQPYQYSRGPSQALEVVNRTHVPRMGDWQFESPMRQIRSSNEPPAEMTSSRGLANSDQSKTEDDSDYFRTFLRSPTRAAYPDPSEYADSGHEHHFEQNRTTSASHVSGESLVLDNKVPDDHQSSYRDDSTASPILKGVKWPGMSLFDSASQEAQRLRNQKKDGSMLEQMQHNSAAVEPMEHIFWPEGRLKKKRLITGNVESSPINEPTPPPKRRKRQAAKLVFSELGENAPDFALNGVKKRRKVIATQPGDLEHTSRRALAAMKPSQLVYSKNAHTTYDMANDLAYTIESNQALEFGRKKAFNVYNDDASQEPATPSKRFPLVVKPSKSPNETSAKDRMHDIWQIDPQKGRLQQEFLRMKDNKENMGPMPGRDEGIGARASDFADERVTQRYFSITGNQPAKFHNTLPHQMDFGGLAGPAFPVSTLNPLNAYVYQHRLQQGHYPRYLSHAPRPSSCKQSIETDVLDPRTVTASKPARTSSNFDN